jgi:anionic cell wall polymer biosynthesis LytR-Cps2A-Psr (LCP) family protein
LTGQDAGAKRGRDASLFLLIAIAVIAVGGAFLIYRILRSDPIEEALSKKEVINILFVIEAEEKPLGAYVLMYSPGNNRAAAISIPPDTGLILKTVDRVDRIDAVYQTRSIAPFRTEVENLLEISLGYDAVFELENLGKMVDLIEGVEIFIPQPVHMYSEPPVLLPSGNTVLDGDKAKQYVRFTIPEEEEDQILLRRERFFLGFLKSLGEKQSRLANSDLAGAFYPLIKSSMNRQTREKLFDALSALDVDRLSMQPVAGNYRLVSGQELLFPYYDGAVIKDIVRQAQRSLSQENPGALVERVFTVEVLNGTATTGLASRTAELIRGFRYDVVSTGNAERNDYERTQIIDRTGLEDVAEAFADTINCKNVSYEARLAELDAGPELRNTDYKADFTLIIGKDFNGRVVTGN